MNKFFVNTLILLVIISTFIAVSFIINGVGLNVYNIWTDKNYSLSLANKYLITGGFFSVIAFVLYRVYDLFFRTKK